jgi:hypothetical protein
MVVFAIVILVVVAIDAATITGIGGGGSVMAVR